MDIIFETVLDFLLEGCISGAKNQKVPKVIRYFLLLIVALVFLALLALMIVLAVSCYFNDNILACVAIIAITFVLFGYLIVKGTRFIREMRKEKNQLEDDYNNR